MILKAGTTVIIHNLSHENDSLPITVNEDFDLSENSIMLQDDYLCSVETIVEDKDGKIIINVYEQDAIVVKDEVLYKSISDVY